MELHRNSKIIQFPSDKEKTGDIRCKSKMPHEFRKFTDDQSSTKNQLKVTRIQLFPSIIIYYYYYFHPLLFPSIIIYYYYYFHPLLFIIIIIYIHYYLLLILFPSIICNFHKVNQYFDLNKPLVVMHYNLYVHMFS